MALSGMDELKTIYWETVVVYYKILPLHSLGETEKDVKSYRSG
jgi:hypothetical protein